MRHALERPSQSIELFSLSEIQAINDYFMQSFYKFYRLFEKCLTTRIQKEIIIESQFESKLPYQLPLEKAREVDRVGVKILDTYFAKRKFGLTLEEAIIVLDDEFMADYTEDQLTVVKLWVYES